ncbi:unnamed protein product [Onchocerca ochengi]|uniref:SUMO-specific isopeptidase USPL1 n=1 Tax=Onchocerca ochengi TaxID=42157 RepID=A0A182E473_ONCOC|nr:unnamed protein product [Onchocerca ochengi]
MTSLPATAASSNLDDITTSLFYQLRDKNRVYDFDILQCPKCPERLEALELDVYKENGQTYQRIWWTCRGIKNKSCHFPLWVPREVFWTRRTEEQMRTGYIPLPNIHLLPQRLWYLYPNVFRNKLSQGDIGNAKKNKSGTVTPSSGHATRGSSVRPESVLTQNEECSQDSFLNTPLLSVKSNTYVPNEMEIWESEVPTRHIRIDEDVEENFEIVKNRMPTVNSQPDASDQKDYEQESSSNLQAKDTVCDSMSWETSLIPECVVTTDFPLESFTDSFVQFCSQTESPTQQQRFEEMNSQEIHSNNDSVILEVLQPAPQDNVSHSSQDLKEAGCNSEMSTKSVRKRKRNSGFEKRFDEAVCSDAVSETSPLDRISLLVPSVNMKVPESVNIAKIREDFQKQRRQRSNSEIFDDDRVIASLMKELVVRVALELDLIKNEATSASQCAEQAEHHLLKIISLEEAKRDFGDLTLDEFLKGVNNLRSSDAAQNCLRKWPKREKDIQRQQSPNICLQQNIDEPIYFEKNDSEAFDNTSTKMTANLRVQSSLRKRQSKNADQPALPRDLPVDEKCIADVEMALKQSIKSIKGAEETSPAPRTSILKGSPSKFRPDMISSEIFDSLNWRRPVHFGGSTNLDAFVTAYNLRYNRAEYLDALGSELCKRKIMKFVPSIPVKQQRLVRRMQQRRSGQQDMLDLEALKKAVDPDALRVQIAHRLDDKVSSKMQHIASAPFTVSPGIREPLSMEYFQSNKDGEQTSVSNLSESLYSFPVSEYENKNKTEKERDLNAPFILSFNDPEVDALVHRKFKNYVYEENATDAVIPQQSSSAQQSYIPEHLEASTSRIEYIDFESAFEEYETDEVQHLDSFFDTPFSGHSL